MRFDLETLRIVLTISLSVVLVLVLARRFRRKVFAKDLPALRHAELTEVRVAYHPPRLVVRLQVPRREEYRTALLDNSHQPLQEWEAVDLTPGDHAIERSLEGRSDGFYHLELRSPTQRTVRRFRLQQA